MNDIDENAYTKNHVQQESKKTDDSALKALEAIGMTVDEVEMHDTKKVRNDDKQICACGHPVARHTDTYGVVYCKPSRMECPCKRIRPVLWSANMRRFLRKTEGPGPAHALARGIVECVKRNEEVEWTIDLVCDRCKKQSDRLVPTPVTQSGYAQNQPTGYDALLCRECLEQV